MFEINSNWGSDTIGGGMRTIVEPQDVNYISNVVGSVRDFFSYPGQVSGLNGIMFTFIWLIQKATYVIIALAVMYFLWGLVKYVRTAAGEEFEEAKGMIINGIIIIFVMVSIWGLVRVFANTVQVNVDTRGTLPVKTITIPR